LGEVGKRWKNGGKLGLGKRKRRGLEGKKKGIGRW